MAGTVVGGLFNAFAFAGAGFLFSKLNHSDYEKEMHRHNLAEEKLHREQKEFFEDQTRKRNRLRQLEKEIATADKDMTSTNDALAEYQRNVSELKQDLQTKTPPKSTYTPSREMQHYQNLVSGLMGLGLGSLAYLAL